MPPKKSSQSRHSASRHRHTLSLQKTEVMINVYDLLPPGKFSTILWTIGSSLLHSGIVINGKEYAFGGHDKRGMTGVYWTKPNSEPPGGTFRCEVLQGFTLAPADEIESIIRAASEEFLGTSYNILTRNCNHFTSYMCEKLTGRPGPAWLNRAASIGIALPCVVPKSGSRPQISIPLMENWSMKTTTMHMKAQGCCPHDSTDTALVNLQGRMIQTMTGGRTTHKEGMAGIGKVRRRYEIRLDG